MMFRVKNVRGSTVAKNNNFSPVIQQPKAADLKVPPIKQDKKQQKVRQKGQKTENKYQIKTIKNKSIKVNQLVSTKNTKGQAIVGIDKINNINNISKVNRINNVNIVNNQTQVQRKNCSKNQVRSAGNVGQKDIRVDTQANTEGKNKNIKVSSEVQVRVKKQTQVQPIIQQKEEQTSNNQQQIKRLAQIQAQKQKQAQAQRQKYRQKQKQKQRQKQKQKQKLKQKQKQKQRQRQRQLRVKRKKEQQQVQEARQKQAQEQIQKILKRRKQRNEQKMRAKQQQQKQEKQLEQLQQRLSNQDSKLGGMMYTNDALAHFEFSDLIMDAQIYKILKTSFHHFPSGQRIQQIKEELQRINSSYMMIKNDENNQKLAEGLKCYRIVLFNRVGQLIMMDQTQGFKPTNFAVIESDTRNKKISQQVQIMKGIPKDKIDKVITSSISKKIQQCSICLQEISVGQNCNILPCNHVFHIECTNNWVQMTANCPSCRRNLKFS